MRVTTLLRSLLGLEETRVLDVNFDELGLVIDVAPTWRRGRCSECGQVCPHPEQRPRRHLGATSMTRPSSSKFTSSTRVPSRPSRERSSVVTRTAHLWFHRWPRNHDATSVAVRTFRHAANAPERIADASTSRSTRTIDPLNPVECHIGPVRNDTADYQSPSCR